MYDDSFKERYKSAPIAISIKDDFIPTQPHIHKEFEILYIINGSSVIKIENETILVKAGDIIFVNPMEIHSIKQSTHNPYYHKCICFDTNLVADKNISDGLLNGYVKIFHQITKDNACTAFIKDLFLSLYTAAESNDEALLLECTGYISLIFASFIKNSLLIENNISEKNAEFCRKVSAYIAKYYNSQISSNSLAKKFYYTQSYFCRTFYKNYGTTFSAYLNMYRIYEAKAMLENSNKKIADIAFECGFVSPEYFSKCFKKQVGILPSEYKKVNCSHK